ncbi:MAG: tetratricopeptide repeat protein [Rickettsiales bacterium]|nr:tetratricopeptide repeat protein [Pseudomonadota bacterium]MDA0965871.1 tetratricopeptide repeat protein [Pseudomonadota bacterium]MDG4542659.1 tetratricopeptide repeat protein [Rickettsiales bacterium]MDG4545163.1 tetratricopeptide repeat protein [Rickettsiales bacterium]MDG4547286.1 tetratricopeptide repeat protein [Rickettsiales bacterium]
MIETKEEKVIACNKYFRENDFISCLNVANEILVNEPENADIRYISALCYIALGQKLDIAESNLIFCINKFPQNPELWFQLGRLYSTGQRLNEAIKAYLKTLELDNNHVAALNNIGNIYNDSGDSATALQYFNRILQINDSLYFVYNNISLIYKKAGLLRDALGYILKAIELEPSRADINHNAALIYLSLGHNQKALEHYQKAFEINPYNIQVATEYRETLSKVCDWDEEKRVEDAINTLLQSENNRDFLVAPMGNIQETSNLAENLEIAIKYTKKQVRNILSIHRPFEHNPSQRGNREKIRIAYMSSDINDHPVSHLMRGVFKNHDKDRFEIYLYSFSGQDKSGYQDEIKSYCNKFIDVGSISNYETARIINEDQIDILIDLNGHTGTSRVEALALKPAPIQVNYLGYIGSMGADFIDYIITDEIVTPKEHQPFYTEKFVYMPNCYQANDNMLEISKDTITKKDEGLPEDKFIFCSFNQSAKIEPVMFSAWMNILKSVPNSVLWLYKGSIYKNYSLTEQNLKKEAKKHGVDADRLIFAEGTPISRHLKRKSLADLALDTRLYNGGTVTSQTLWAGIPVLTLKGENFASRMASSILHSVGIDELITHTIEEYEQKAIEIALCKERAKALKATLTGNIKTKPLFNTEQFTKDLERSYELMFDNYIQGNGCKPIKVSRT